MKWDDVDECSDRTLSYSFGMNCMVSPEWTSTIRALLCFKEEKDALVKLGMERAVLTKIMYKNRNQHRGTAMYDKMKHVEKLLKTLEGKMSRHYDTSEGKWVSFVQGLRTASKPLNSEHERLVPSAESGLSMLRVALNNCQIAEKLSVACYRAAKSCSGQLAHSFFMPLSLMCLAIVSRVQVLAAQILVKCSREYNSVVDLIQYLPRSGKGTDIDYTLPRMVQCKIEKGAIPALRQFKQVEENWWKDYSEQRVHKLSHDGMVVPGLRTLTDEKAATHFQANKDFCSKHLGVMEDRGQPISRDELLAMVCSKDHVSEVAPDNCILPAFEVDKICNTPLIDKKVIDEHRKEKTLKISKLESAIITKQCVPSLPKTDTAFIRIGGSSKEMGFNPLKDKGKSTLPAPMSSSVQEKSWEDWIGRPSAPSTRPPDGPQFGSKKRKKRRTK